ncbi:MAG: phosphoethanolamine--lipid A transferase EptA [Gammaproteobacteria bacterium]|nr:phosphoethanolamine--lipid A transferase EptA [Gammaproteobacteria bacterium]
MSNILFLNRKWEMTASRFILIFSAFNTFLFNTAVFNYLNSNLDLLSVSGISIAISITSLIYILNVTILSLLVLITPHLSKIFLIVTALINGAAIYYINTFQVVLDLTMIGNIFNTRASEAIELLVSGTLYAYILMFGIIPGFIVFRTRIVQLSRFRVSINLVIVLVLGIVLILVNASGWLWISKHRNMVRGKILPWAYVINTTRYTAEKLKGKSQPILLPDGVFSDTTKTVVVLVIGESARAGNFSLYGYEKDTNPYMASAGVLAFNKTNSCATYTTASVACILSHEKGNDQYENLPSYLTRIGADVIWRTNNWGEADINVAEYKKESELVGDCTPGTCDLDENMLIGLQQRIESSNKKKILVVLHTKGSHGPSYYSRYSPDMEKFTPVCRNEEVSKCTYDELINAYDNSIVYTDYLLHKTITMLKGMSSTPSMMVYISDHGESLGEDGMYLHGIPYTFAPDYQKDVPFIIWRSNALIAHQGIENQNINQSGAFSQANIFHTIMGAFGVKTEIYDVSLDVIHHNQKPLEMVIQAAGE